MRYLFMTFLFLIGLILQSTVFPHLTIAGVKPDLILILTVLFALMHGSLGGATAGLMGGFLQDILFGQNLGMNALSKMIVGYLFGVLERKIYKENILIPMFALFVGTFINETILYWLRLFSGSTDGYFTSLKDTILSIAIYNSFLVPFIYAKFYKSSKKGLLRMVDR